MLLKYTKLEPNISGSLDLIFFVTLKDLTLDFNLINKKYICFILSLQFLLISVLNHLILLKIYELTRNIIESDENISPLIGFSPLLLCV